MPAYGVFPPPADPNVEIIDFTYTPATTIQAGETVTFQVTMHRNDPNAYVKVRFGDQDNPANNEPRGVIDLDLFDDGNTPDDMQGDGIYTGEYEWDYGARSELPVMARQAWGQYWQSDIVWFAHPLTIVEPEVD